MARWTVVRLALTLAAALALDAAAAAAVDGVMTEDATGVQKWLEEAVAWIRDQGDLAAWYYVLFLAVWIVCLLPCSVVEVVPGYLFGFRTGMCVALAGKVLGASMSFAVGRLLLRERLRAILVARFPKLVAVSAAVEEEGLPLMVVVRLSYVPMLFKNYGLPVLVDVDFVRFLAAAIISGAPFAALWSLLGSSSGDLAGLLRGERPEVLALLPEDPLQLSALAVGGLLLLFAAGSVILRVKRRVADKLAQLEAAGGEPAATEAKAAVAVQEPAARGWVWIAVGALAGLGMLYWAKRDSLPSLKSVMLDSVDWIHAQGSMGPVYYVAFLAVWVAALLPCSILEMVPGYLFGFRTGVVVSIVGKNIGTVISLLIGRYLLRGMIQASLVARYPKLLALEKAVKMEGFPVLLMIRCAYLPMLVKNYGLSCLDISIFQIWIASVCASFPFAALWTFVGASATNLGDIFEGKLSPRDVLPDNALVLAGVGLPVVLAFVLAFGRFMRRFNAILAEAEQAATAAPDAESKKVD